MPSTKFTNAKRNWKTWTSWYCMQWHKCLRCIWINSLHYVLRTSSTENINEQSVCVCVCVFNVHVRCVHIHSFWRAMMCIDLMIETKPETYVVNVIRNICIQKEKKEKKEQYLNKRNQRAQYTLFHSQPVRKNFKTCQFCFLFRLKVKRIGQPKKFTLSHLQSLFEK